MTVDSERWDSGIIALRDNTRIVLPSLKRVYTAQIVFYDYYGLRLESRLQVKISLSKSGDAPFVPPATTKSSRKKSVCAIIIGLGLGIWLLSLEKYHPEKLINGTGAQTINDQLPTVNSEQHTPLNTAGKEKPLKRPGTDQKKSIEIDQDSISASKNDALAAQTPKKSNILYAPLPTDGNTSPEHTIRGNNKHERTKKPDLTVIPTPKVGDVPAATSKDSNILFAPSPHVGDSYTYQTIYSNTPSYNNTVRRDIVEIDHDQIKMRNVNLKSGYTRFVTLDRNLGVKALSEGSTFEPALKYFNFPGIVGQSWEAISTENKPNYPVKVHKSSGSILSVEQMTVPAGTFTAWKIFINSVTSFNDKIEYGTDISWYAPEVRRSVKSELESKDEYGQIIEKKTIELIAFSVH